MAINHIFNIAGSAMSAQTARLTTTASNLSNAEVVAGSADEAYRARYPVFEAAMKTTVGEFEKNPVGVAVKDIVESEEQPIKQYQPNHPLANEEGYIFLPKVNMVEEMTNMISASRSYQMNAEMLGTAKKLLLQTLQLGE